MPSRWSARRARFRQVVNGDRCHYPGSVHDPVSARIAADIGFEVGMFAGSTGSLSVLAAPDLITLTLTEFAQQCLRISRAADLSLMVDADHGYGNALNVMRTVEELETAGVAGLSIEDTLLPRGYGPSDKAELISLEEGVGKMKAAIAGRNDPDLVIAGRTSAVAISGLDDCIRRIQAYEAAGVDIIFCVGVKSRDQLDAISASIKLPLILGPVPDAVGTDLDYLSARRVRLCLQGHQPFQATVQAIYNTLKALREGTLPKDLEGLASADLMRRVTRADDYDRWTKDWLGGGEG